VKRAKITLIDIAINTLQTVSIKKDRQTFKGEKKKENGRQTHNN
jgi:hypothetical protein